jgi:GT2 family glycosyltransferase
MISLLIVNYRSASLASDAIRTARSTTTAPLQVVVVDNSCDANEARVLEAVADVVVAARTNLGYSGGINLGRHSCKGSTLIVSNPDVTFGTGALDALHHALSSGAAVAGPALYWDEEHQWILPPADTHTTAAKVDEVLASRASSWARQRDERRIRKRLAFWAHSATTEVEAVSGAVMAVNADDFDALGGFDERFSLYFEEIDFQRRVSDRDKRIVYVPDARCRHLYNQSAGQDTTAAGAAFLSAELQFLEKWSGPFAARALKHLERAPRAHDAQRVEGAIPVDEPLHAVIEVSPLAHFATAAGTFPRTDRVDLPADVWRTVGARPLYFRVIDRRDARVLATYVRYGS